MAVLMEEVMVCIHIIMDIIHMVSVPVIMAIIISADREGGK